MIGLKKYIRAISFGLSYAFEFAWKQSAILVLLVICRAILPYLSSYYLGRLVDGIVSITKTTVDYNQIWYLLFFYVLVTSIPSVLGNIQFYFRRLLYSILSIELDLSILRKREAIDIATYEDPVFQDLNQRAFRNGLGPIYNITTGQLETLYSITSLIVGTVIAVHFNLLIYLVIILSAAPSFFVDMKFASRNWSIWAKDSPEQRRYADLRQHIIGKTSLTETKLLQSGNKIFNWIKTILVTFNRNQIKNEKSRLFQTSITDIVSSLGLLVGLLFLVKQVITGIIPVGKLVYLIGTFFNVRSAISGLLTTISNQYEDSLIANDIIDIVNTPSIILEPLNPVKMKLNSAPEIIFENVGFKYNNSNKWSLRNLNITFIAGENIGLVGNNGAGKTTLVKLLCRIYDPVEGRILINGTDLKEISTKEWWSYLAVMFQDYASYDFITKDAIAIGRPDKNVNLTKVVEAAHTSQAYSFIEEWEKKYDEQIGVEFSGKEPSKGQRQKLSIAKTLYRDGLVMILDEPTASVDAESESKIFDSIENLPKNRTAILISHDFSTISACDKIFVLDKGKLIEEGNHKELMGKKGMYANLYNLQAERFKK
jgi:ATP-binding cassette subfamily B protein